MTLTVWRRGGSLLATTVCSVVLSGCAPLTPAQSRAVECLLLPAGQDVNGQGEVTYPGFAARKPANV